MCDTLRLGKNRKVSHCIMYYLRQVQSCCFSGRQVKQGIRFVVDIHFQQFHPRVLLPYQWLLSLMIMACSLFYSRVVSPCLVGFAVSFYHDNFDDTRIGGRKAVNQVFADAISLNAFHPSGFVAQIVCILGSIRNAVMRLQL